MAIPRAGQSPKVDGWNKSRTKKVREGPERWCWTMTRITGGNAGKMLVSEQQAKCSCRMKTYAKTQLLECE